MDYKELQARDKEWLEHNFPDNTPGQAVLGIGEEIGELAELDASDHIKYLAVALGKLNHARLKMEQKIRGSKEVHIKEMKDALADIQIYSASLCNLMGFSLDDIVTEVANEVFRRDWIKFPYDGLTR